jgi:AraC-like DNA-binding protein
VPFVPKSATILKGRPVWATHAPNPALAPHVSAYWTVELRGGTHVIRTLPDACIDLTVDLAGPAKAYLAGPQRRAKNRQLRGDVHLVAARLMPGSARLLGARIEVLHEDWTPLDRFVKKSEVRRLESRFDRAGSLSERLGVLEAFLLDKLLNHMVDVRLSRVLRMIYEAEGDVPVSHLASATKVSLRTLVRLFESWVGLSPKRFLRVVRFQSALRALDGPTSGADLAARLGYADQAHLIRDVKELFGATPTEILRLAPDTR